LIAIDPRDGSVQEDVNAVHVGVSFEVVDHVIAGREQWCVLAVWPTGQMRELTAGVEFESVVSRPPAGRDVIRAIDQHRPTTPVFEAEGRRDSRRAGTDDDDIAGVHWIVSPLMFWLGNLAFATL
jgi:hypothetical protein